MSKKLQKLTPHPKLFTEKLESSIKLHKPLPKELVNPQAGEHLYMIGSAYYRRDEVNTKRYKFHLPVFFLTVNTLVFLKTSTIIFLPPKYDDWLIWLGDVSLILKLKVHFNLLLLTFDYIIFFLHALHYLVEYKYRKYGIRPNTYPFDLAAGLISPRSVGLTDRHKVLVFARFCKSSLSSCLFLTRYVMNVFCWIAYFSAFVVKMVTMDSVAVWFVCFGQSLVWLLKCHIFFTYFYFHMLHFYIVCFYLRLKIGTIQTSISRLKEINSELPIKTKKNFRILALILSLKNILAEINEFNGSFWSKFIFCVWSSYSINITMFIYSAIYGKVAAFILGIIWVVSIIEIISVVALCWIASSVNKKAKMLYLSLNSLSLQIGTLNLRTKYKFSACVETWSSKRIGFTNWRLFSMNYFTFYEMVAIVATFFLKLVQMQYEM